MKTCATCQQDKPLSDFGTRPNEQGRVYVYRSCRACAAAARRADRVARERSNARQRAVRSAARAEVAVSREIDLFVPVPGDRRAPLPTLDELGAWYSAGCPL